MGMPLISWRILSGRVKKIHSALFIRLLAKILSSPTFKGPSICCLRCPKGSQKSAQALTLSLLAIDHLRPLLKITPPPLQAFHIREAVWFLECPLKRSGVRYLQVSIWAHGISRLEAIRQQSLPAGERHLDFQPFNFAWTLSTTKWNSLHLLPLWIKGKPR